MGAEWRQGVMDAVAASCAAQLKKLLEIASKQHLDFRMDFLSPLTLAAANGNYAMVDILLCAEANVEFTDETGRTPLMAAVSGGNPTICSLLLHHGAKVHACNHCVAGFTALHYAARDGMHEAAAVLLQHGAEIYHPPKPWVDFNRSPLGTAIFYRSGMVEYFLDYLHNHGSEVPLTFVLRTAITQQEESSAIVVLQKGYFPFKDKSIPSLPIPLGFERCTSYFHLAASFGLPRLMSWLVELNPYHLQEEWLVQNRLPVIVTQHPEFVNWLMKNRRQPASLIRLCKSTILAHLGDYYMLRIDSLPLPKLLQTVLASIESSHDDTPTIDLDALPLPKLLQTVLASMESSYDDTHTIDLSMLQ